eukprot:GHVU01130534.1.p1 GENE.GHVU01130534.1~~GHVU01130534.1.p1  ORF type:complete len:175 (+),score=15.70 GHVU01130534.1:201-725(+)
MVRSSWAFCAIVASATIILLLSPTAAQLTAYDDHDHDNDTNHDDESAGGVWNHKVGAMVVIVVISSLGVGLPFILKGTKSFWKVQPYLMAFGGGSFFGLALFRLLPECIEQLEAAGVFIYVGDAGSRLNAAYPILVGSFAVMYIIELLFGASWGTARHPSIRSSVHFWTHSNDD